MQLTLAAARIAPHVPYQEVDDVRLVLCIGDALAMLCEDVERGMDGGGR